MYTVVEFLLDSMSSTHSAKPTDNVSITQN